MSRYAKNTKVDPARSRGEIEKLLTRFGADQFGYMNDTSNNRAHIIFSYDGMRIRVSISLPRQDEFTKTATGLDRSANEQINEYRTECRRRWRSLVLLIKSKLVAVGDEVALFEEEFLPYVLWSNGQTTAEQLAGKIREIASSGAMPNLLGMPEGV